MGTRLALLMLALLVAAPQAVSGDAAPVMGGSARLAHLLDRATFGATPSELARAERVGERAWLREQLAPPPGGADPGLDARLRVYPLYGRPPASIFLWMYERDYVLNAEGERQVDDLRVLDQLTEWRLLRAVESRWQLREMMVELWFNHFNVFWDKGAQLQYAMPEYFDAVLRPHALGRFRDLLRAVAHSPPMLLYLDNDSSTRGAPNENFARELMELHTVGIRAGYTQRDVREVARCLTGWTVTWVKGPDPYAADSLLEFRFDPQAHDPGPKYVLGEAIPAGGGVEDGERVLDLLASHPSTARHVCRKLVRRFVDDEPPEALVERAAAVFRRTDGDLARVMEEILTAPELYEAPRRRAKMKTPLEVVAATMRVLGASPGPGWVTNNYYEGQTLAMSDSSFLGRRPLEPSEAMRRMGAPMFECLLPDGYPDDRQVWGESAYMFERIALAGKAASLFAEEFRSRHRPRTVADVARQLLPGDAEAQARFGDAPLGAGEGEVPLEEALAIVLASPEFQLR